MVTTNPTRERSSRGLLVDISPLRESPAFARLWAGGAISGIGAQMTVVAVGLHIYALTESTFAVALVGAFALIPMIIAGLYGGMLADAFDRRLILIWGSVIAWGSTIALASLAWLGIETVWPFYLLTTVNAVAATVIGTVRFAVIPRILPAHLLPAASALSGISVGVMVTVGPALAGVLVATVGFGWTYTIDAVLFIASFLGILALPRLAPEGDVDKPGLASLVSGFRFLKTAPNVRMSFVVDIIAMTFGQPRVLFPAVGALVLGGGAITVGILIAAGAIGALATSILSGRLGQVRMQGQAIARSIIAYGAFILGFGVLLAVLATGWFGPVGASIESANMVGIVIAAILLAGAGGADNISAIFRMTMLQTAVPDSMRGRLQGVFTVVVTGGPRLGDIYVGAVAAFGALWLPPLAGGLAIIVLVAVLVRTQRTFRHYDALDPRP
ncbi:MFS transporter [Leifsonia kafniensis]|uniref:MFS transporter n=1 Tax=Leifsonia kafniensis TaxID=475957 RepID=A0ABP7K4Y8_9MICO